MIWEINENETPYFLASHASDPCCGPSPLDFWGAPTPRGIYSLLMEATNSSVREDLRALLPTAPRPFDHISSVLSLWVPRKRWAGRTQALLSQRCRTSKPLGIEPKCISHEKRCACAKSFLDNCTRPYPRDKCRFHTQQPSDRWTLDQKRSIGSRFLALIDIIYSSYVCAAAELIVCH